MSYYGGYGGGYGTPYSGMGGIGGAAGGGYEGGDVRPSMGMGGMGGMGGMRPSMGSMGGGYRSMGGGYGGDIGGGEYENAHGGMRGGMRPSMGMGSMGMGGRHYAAAEHDGYDNDNNDDGSSLYDSHYAHPPRRPGPRRYQAYSAPGRRPHGFIHPASLPSDVDDLGPDSDYGSNAADPGEFRYGAPDAGYWDSFDNGARRARLTEENLRHVPEGYWSANREVWAERGPLRRVGAAGRYIRYGEGEEGE